MPRYGTAAAALLLTAIAIACGAPPPEYRPSSTIKDIMQSTIDPQADVVWNAVATVVTTQGLEERAPHTDKEWTAVRHAAVTLLEATNLIIMPGRRVARSGEKSDNPHIELSPDEIQALLDGDPRRWLDYAHGLHDAVSGAIQAIDAHDAAKLLEAGEKIDMACENCHRHYWYPGVLGPRRVR